MKIVVGMATFKGREQSVEKAIQSLMGQVNEIVLYDNEVNDDLTDNGKFYGLTTQKKPCYYFSCDDDLLYPPDYIETMIEGIEKYGCIVTHHGRRLSGLNRSYYRAHQVVHCLRENRYDNYIDVAGTGVTGFRTDYFNPKGIHLSNDQKMSDLVFSLEAIKQNKRIVALKHKKGWIKHLDIDITKSIHATESGREERQKQLADEIYRIRNKNT